MDGAFCQALGEDMSRPQDLPLRIRILCYITGVRRSCIPTIGMQLRGNTRRRRDHRNPHFAAMLPAGAVRMPASRSCRTSATKSPLGLFKEISPKRNFFQRDPRRGSLSFHAAKRHENSLLLRFAEARRFRALRSATKGSAFGIRKPFEKGLIENFVPWCASKGMFKVVSAKLSAAVPSRGRLEAHLNFMLT